MTILRSLLLILLLTATHAGAAFATPITFQLDSVTIVASAFPTTQGFLPSLPILGSGDLNLSAGTGFLSLPGHFIAIDINNDGNDARLTVVGWSQTITSIDGSGNISSTGGGSVSCLVLGGLGTFICGAVQPTVGGWKPADGPVKLSSAVINPGLKTITVIDNSNSTAGTVTSSYSYAFVVPEPSTALLAGLGLAGLAGMRRRQRG